MDQPAQLAVEPVVPVVYARQPAQHGRARRKWLVLGAVVVLALGTVGAIYAPSFAQRLFRRDTSNESVYVVKPVDLSITLKEDGELKPKNSVDIKCEVEGQSTILKVVDESTKVKKGDVLVELASDAIKERLDAEEIELDKSQSAKEVAEQDLELTRRENASKLEKCQITLDLAQLELQRYLEGDYEKARVGAELAIRQTEMDIERKRDDLDKNRELAEKGFVTKSKLEQLEFELEKAQMQLQQNKLAKVILEQYEKPKNEKEKKSDMDQAEQELEREKQRCASREKQAAVKVDTETKQLETRTRRVNKLREQYAKCKIVAPVDGVVQYPNEEMNWHMGGSRIAAGEKVFEGQTLVVLPDTSQMVVTTRIHEADRHKVQEGAPCVITVPAVPGRALTGKVERIARFADTTNRWLNPDLKEHATEILLDQTDAAISPGDSAEIKIFIDEVTSALAVPVQCVFTRGSKSYVFIDRGGDPQYVEVKLGRSSTSMVEVTEGLSEGDSVLMRATDAMLATLPAPPPTPNTGPKAPGAKSEAAVVRAKVPEAPPPTTQAAASQPASQPVATPATITPPNSAG